MQLAGEGGGKEPLIGIKVGEGRKTSANIYHSNTFKFIFYCKAERGHRLIDRQTDRLTESHYKVIQRQSLSTL